VILVICCELLIPATAWSAEDPLVMAIFPRRNAAATITLFKPMAAYLSRQLGREVKLVTTRDFPSFWKGVVTNQYDIVHYNQYHYIKSHADYGYEVILKNEEFGQSLIAGALVVRKDSGINTLQDLKGKKILFGGGPKAMQSYIVTTLLLRRAGLMQGDYQELFAKNPPNACVAVFHKHADAAGTGDLIVDFPAIQNRINTDEIRFLALSKKMEQLPWAVKGGMDTALRIKIQSILSTLKDSGEGRSVLKQAKLTNLLTVENAHYDIHREVIKELAGYH
jgi:phosphonate transport system substrate-binding protein